MGLMFLLGIYATDSFWHPGRHLRIDDNKIRIIGNRLFHMNTCSTFPVRKPEVAKPEGANLRGR